MQALCICPSGLSPLLLSLNIANNNRQEKTYSGAEQSKELELSLIK